MDIASSTALYQVKYIKPQSSIIQMEFQGYLENLCQQFLHGDIHNRDRVEAEICSAVGSPENLDKVLLALSMTEDSQCTLFIGLELLAKTYMANTRIGSITSIRLRNKEKIDAVSSMPASDKDTRIYRIFEACGQMLVRRSMSASECIVDLS